MNVPVWLGDYIVQQSTTASGNVPENVLAASGAILAASGAILATSVINDDDDLNPDIDTDSEDEDEVDDEAGD